MDCDKINLFSCNINWTNNNQIFPWDYNWPPFYDDEENVGDLTLNLYIHGDVQTRPYNWQYPNASDFPYLPPINVEPYASLKLADDISLNLTTITSNSFYSDFFMNIKINANLILGQNTKININNRNHLTLGCGSNLYCSTNGGPSIINVFSGGQYCNLGTNKHGLLQINY